VPSPLDALGKPSRDVLVALKAHGPSTTRALSKRIGCTFEAVRRAGRGLEEEGWVTRAAGRPATGRPRRGRPSAQHALSAKGEELFPRAYADLAVALVDAVASTLGAGALRRVLATITDARVAALEPLVAGQPLERRLAAIRAVYRDPDPHLSVRRAGGAFAVEERNCPFLAVALERPALCSTTVSTLSRLLGVRVVRDVRFQEGAGRCVFRVDPTAPRPEDAPDFALEPEPPRSA
jgi:predicted ArsR family transcriptional regulator